MAGRQFVFTSESVTEGHPDNASPAVLGGLIVAVMIGHKVVARKIEVAPLAVQPGRSQLADGHPRAGGGNVFRAAWTPPPWQRTARPRRPPSTVRA